jgi:adenosyl cobinamide kinase/adenosyl cobinamide phosphate guanylyltransferase
MPLVLVTGGARSGKSELAERLASEQDAPVVLLATAEPDDEEMAARIAEHRRDRPASWQTMEEPRRLNETIETVAEQDCLIVDCLTLWVANVLDRGAAEVEAEAESAAGTASGRAGLTIAVTNEVGLGLVPDNVLGRSYRDLLGRVNSIWAAAADVALLLVAGRLLRLERPDSLAEWLR